MSQPKVDVVGLLERLEKALPPLFEVAVTARALSLSDASDAIAVCKNARAAVDELIDAAREWCALMPGLAGGPEFDRLRAAAYNIGPQS